MRNTRQLLVAFVMLIAACCPAQEISVPQTLQLAKGTYWIYEGSVRWTVPNSNKVASKTIRWRMEVVDTLKRREFFSARVKGAPWDLGWYEPGRDRGDFLFVVINQAVYMAHDIDAREVDSALRRTGLTQELRERLKEHIWFRLPFRINARYCEPDQESRPDRNYCWIVNSIGSTRISGVSGIADREYGKIELMYRTIPEHEILEFVPGIGITHWSFQHHGTVAEANVKLVEFHSPNPE